MAIDFDHRLGGLWGNNLDFSMAAELTDWCGECAHNLRRNTDKTLNMKKGTSLQAAQVKQYLLANFTLVRKDSQINALATALGP